MKINRRNHGKTESVAMRRLWYLAIYTGLFLLIAAGVFFVFFRDHRSLVWGVDGTKQYMPKAYYYMIHGREFIKNLLHGKFVFEMYDFSIGYGDAVMHHTEPLYLLYLLFHAEDIEEAFVFLALLRLYLAGLAVYGFLRYFKRDEKVSMFAGFIYIFAGYALWGGTRHNHFLCGMIMLPLMILAIEEICRERRWYLCTITVALNLWCGYYFTYMNTFAMGIYFLVRYFTGKQKKSVADFFRKGFTIAGTYLLGIGIANITFFNTFANLLRSERSSQAAEKVTVNLASWGHGWLVRCYQAFINNGLQAGSWMLLGFIPLCYFLVTLLLIRKGKIEQKILLVIGFILSMFPVFSYIMMGFGSTYCRWSYILAFLIAVISAYEIPELFSLSIRDLLILGATVVPYVLVGCLGLFGYKVKNSSIATSVFLIVTYLCVWIIHLINKRSKKLAYGMLYATMIVSFWVSGYIRYDRQFGDMASEFTKAGKALQTATDTPLKVYKEIEDDSFYRIDTHKDIRTQNSASLILGDKSLSFQNSTINKKINRFMIENGATDWILVALMGLDGRSNLYALNDVKYFIMNQKDTYEVPYGFDFLKTVKQGKKKYDIYWNPDALPFGYTYDSVMSNSQAEKYQDWEKQEVMLQTAILPDSVMEQAEALKENLYGEPEVQIKKVPVTDIQFSSDESYLTDTGMHVKGKDTVTVTFTGIPGCETYLIWENGLWDATSYQDVVITSGNRKKVVDFRGNGDNYYTRQKSYVFNLGYSDEARNTCEIRFSKECELQFSELSIACLPMDHQKQYMQERKADVLENVEFSANQVKGTISLEKEKLLVFSVPELNGWTCRIDGEKRELLSANYMFMSVPVPAGDHEITLTYEMPGIRISLMMTGICIVILILLMWLTRKKKDLI